MDNSMKAMLVERAKARRLYRLDPESDWNEIVQLVENQPRLRHFVYCLYTGQALLPKLVEPFPSPVI